MSASNLSDNASVQSLSNNELEQINGGVISVAKPIGAISLIPTAKIPPLGACAPCTSGGDRFILNDLRFQNLLTPQLSKATLGF